MIPKDTDIKAVKIQFAVFKNVDILERFRKTLDLSDHLQEISREAIKNRNLDYTNQQVVEAYLKLILKKSLFIKIFNNAQIKPWQGKIMGIKNLLEKLFKEAQKLI